MSCYRMLLPVVCVAVVWVGPCACLAQGKAPEQRDWKDVAKSHGVTLLDIDALARDKLRIADESYRQVFTPYIESELPLFITSDSLLAAFHALFEESVFRLESANAERLPGYLRNLWVGLGQVDASGAGKLEVPARRRAQIVLAVAMRLAALGDASVKGGEGSLDKDVAAVVADEVKRVTAATAAEFMPAWLGRADGTFLGLDYTRDQPRGFYAKTEALQRYFRAVSWLQSIPFRQDRDEEFLAILMLGGASRLQKSAPGDWREFIENFSYFIGDADDWTIMMAGDYTGEVVRAKFSPDAIDTQRKEFRGIARRRGGPQINDQLRLPPATTQSAAEPNFRILSAYRTPDGVMFHRTMNRPEVWPRLATGLEVCAALGSDFACEHLVDPKKDKVLAIIKDSRPLFVGSGLYRQYLDCLAALLDKPEPDAPAFMASPAWQAKSCQTALAGWAQLRHTWALQAKEAVVYACENDIPRGFIEPEPEFFGRMAKLSGECEKRFQDAGVFAAPEHAAVTELRRAIKVLRASPEKHAGLGAGEFAWRFLTRLEPPIRDIYHMTPKELALRLEAISDDIEQGKMKLTREQVGVVEEWLFSLAPRWRMLAELCSQLESLAHKQLRGRPLTKDQETAIGCYGFRLAGIMFYAGNSYVTPRDDVPRIIDVAIDPNQKARCLEVGVGRPRAIYVLYPWQGREVLCRGAVMSYYEFAHPSRLTDEAWKTMFDSKDRPAAPTWVERICSPLTAKGATP